MFPWQLPYAYPSPYRVHKAVVLVRNPFDALFSYLNILITKDHSTTLSRSMFESYKAEFRDMIRLALPNLIYSYKWWLSQPIPTHIIRYEDLVIDPGNTLLSLFEFLLDEPDLKGFEIAKRIEEVVMYSQNPTLLESKNKNGKKVAKIGRMLYKPRSGVILNSFEFYDEELIKEFSVAKELLEQFGYIEDGKNTRLAFFKVQDYQLINQLLNIQ